MKLQCYYYQNSTSVSTLLPFLILRKVMSYDMQEINRLSRSSSCYGPSYSTTSSSNISTISSTPNTPTISTTATISTTSTSTPSSPMRSSFGGNPAHLNTNNSNSTRNYTARDLIREFMAKNCSPPAILKPSYQPFEYSQDLELAYKHPQLLRVNGDNDDNDHDGQNVDDKEDPEKDYLSSSSSITINERYEQLVESVKMRMRAAAACLDRNANNLDDNSRNESESNMNLKGCSSGSSNHNGKVSSSSSTCSMTRCKLVGNVAENIIKTWEQINANRSCTTANGDDQPRRNNTLKRDLVLARKISNNSEDNEPMMYYEQVDENIASFHVNKVVYSEKVNGDDYEIDGEDEPSDNFYDSIDDGNNNDDENGNVDSDDNMISISQEDAGEELADSEYDRKKQHWSLDSDLRLERRTC